MARYAEIDACHAPRAFWCEFRRMNLHEPRLTDSIAAGHRYIQCLKKKCGAQAVTSRDPLGIWRPLDMAVQLCPPHGFKSGGIGTAVLICWRDAIELGAHTI